MFGWSGKSRPLSTKQMIQNTDAPRIKRAMTQIEIIDYTQELIIKKLSLFDKVKNFFSRNKVNTLFIKFIVKCRNKTNGHVNYVHLVVPYFKNMNERVLSDQPIQVYSTSKDFKFRFAWELFQKGNCYTNAYITKDLGPALTVKPTKVKPLGSPQFDKYIYGVIAHIDSLKVKL